MLYNVILSDIKDAMKTKNTDKRDVLKQVQAKAQAEAKEGKCEITDEIVVNALNKELKQLNQTFEAIKMKTGSDLYKSTVIKIEILRGYLPEQLSEDECLAEVSKILNANVDMPTGKLTGLVMKSLKGKADNKLIKDCVDTLLKNRR